LLTEQVGFSARRHIFDPNIFAICDRYRGTQSLRAPTSSNRLPEIRKTCPHARISGGVSNVSFSFVATSRFAKPSLGLLYYGHQAA